MKKIANLLILLILIPSLASAKSIKDKISFFVGSESPIIERYQDRSSIVTNESQVFERRALDSVLTGVFVELYEKHYLSIGTTHLLNRGFKTRVAVDNIAVDLKFKEKELQFAHYYMFVPNLFLTNTITRTTFTTKSSSEKVVENFLSYAVGLEYNLTDNLSAGIFFGPGFLSNAKNPSHSTGVGLYYSM